MPVIRTRRPGTSAGALGAGARPTGALGGAAARPGALRARRRQPLLDGVEAATDRPQLGAQVAQVIRGCGPPLLDRPAHPVAYRLGAGLGALHQLVDRVLRPRAGGLGALARDLKGAVDRLPDCVGQALRRWLAVRHGGDQSSISSAPSWPRRSI